MSDHARWRYQHVPGTGDDRAVQLPTPAGPPLPRDMIVDADIIARLTQRGVEVTAAYTTLLAWEALGQEVTAERYIRDVWRGDVHKLWILDALRDHGLVVTPSEARERYLDDVEAVYGTRFVPTDYGVVNDPPGPATPKPQKKRLVVPDPFPTYLDQAWDGTRADWWETCPRPGRDVVYFLYGDDEELLYIGSTSNVYGRFPAHASKPWTSYLARRCADRNTAYWLEAREIIDHDPPHNQGDSVRGRINALRRPAGR